MAISKRLRYEVLRRDRRTCQLCGAEAPWVFLEIDHVIPRSQGGTDAPENLQVLCEDCNAGKSATMPARWMVAAARRVAKYYRHGEPQQPPEDDYSEMYAYMDAVAELQALTAERALRCVTHVMADAYPYRPHNSELIIAAAALAATGYGAPKTRAEA